jgi:hypothetical protein
LSGIVFDDRNTLGHRWYRHTWWRVGILAVSCDVPQNAHQSVFSNVSIVLPRLARVGE